MDIEAEKILVEIAEKAQLAEGVEGLRSILLTMYRFPSLKNKILAQKTGIAVPAIAAVRNELVKAGIIEKRNFLGKKGREWVKRKLNLRFEYDPIPGIFDNLITEVPDDLAYLKNIKQFLENRPIPEFALDQSHADYSTILKRTLFLLKNGDLEGRRIVFLGDDDTTSILVGMTKLAKEITVVDIDKRILGFLSEVSEEINLKNYNVIHHDLRDPCPKSLINRYDVVVMDPPYTNEGLRLFLKRAKQVLKTTINFKSESHPIVGKKCLLSFGNKPPGDTLELQLSILDHGFIVKEMIPDFNHYKGASILGQFSHLYYLSSVIHPNPKYDISYSAHPIYTSELKGKKELTFLPIGFHFIGEMRFDSQSKILDNTTILYVFQEALSSAQLEIIDIFNHNYKPYGYSTIAILQTSHAALHTWPEHGYISIDIFICDDFQKGVNALKMIKQNLNPIKSEFFYTERGKEAGVEYKLIEL